MYARLLSLVAVTVLLAGSSEAAEWRIDPMHSSIGFGVKHLMVSIVHGTFDKYDSKISFDPPDLKSFSAEITIDVSSVNTRVEMRDNDLRSDHFFDVANYPTMTYKSKKIESIGDGRYRVTGDLTMKGVTKEVVLEGEGFTPIVKSPRGSMVTAVSAQGTLNREDFGITFNFPLESGGVTIGREITLEIDLELTKVE